MQATIPSTAEQVKNILFRSWATKTFYADPENHPLKNLNVTDAYISTGGHYCLHINGCEATAEDLKSYKEVIESKVKILSTLRVVPSLLN